MDIPFYYQFFSSIESSMIYVQIILKTFHLQNFDPHNFQDYGRDRRRHSSADDFRTRVLEKRALERKDSNHSESSEGSLEVRHMLRKDSSHSDSTDSRSEHKLEEVSFDHADGYVLHFITYLLMMIVNEVISHAEKRQFKL